MWSSSSRPEPDRLRITTERSITLKGVGSEPRRNRPARVCLCIRPKSPVIFKDVGRGCSLVGKSFPTRSHNIRRGMNNLRPSNQILLVMRLHATGIWVTVVTKKTFESTAATFLWRPLLCVCQSRPVGDSSRPELWVLLVCSVAVSVTTQTPIQRRHHRPKRKSMHSSRGNGQTTVKAGKTGYETVTITYSPFAALRPSFQMGSIQSGEDDPPNCHGNGRLRELWRRDSRCVQPVSRPCGKSHGAPARGRSLLRTRQDVLQTACRTAEPGIRKLILV